MLTFSMMTTMKRDEDEKAILTALRSSPRLKACILEMVDITDGDAFEELNNGDDAEEAVVGAIQKTGTTLSQDWVEKKNAKAEEEIRANKSYRTHKKRLRWQTSVGKIEVEEQHFLYKKKRGIGKRSIAPLRKAIGMKDGGMMAGF